MKSMITLYKKTALLATVVAAISMSSVISAGCSACAAAAAIRQSIRDAQAAALAAGGQKVLKAELDEIDFKDMQAAEDRAAREQLSDPCNCSSPCSSIEETCSLNCKLQTLYNCCVCNGAELRRQGHEAKKCCKKLRHEINDVEDQVEESSAALEVLILSQTDQAAACCSVIETLILSQIDQSAICCSVTDSRLGDPAVTIPSLQDCFIDVIDFVNTNDDDVMTWLKRLYVLMYQVFSCNCCQI